MRTKESQPAACAQEPGESWIKAQPHALRMEINLGYPCNNRCMFCTELPNRSADKTRQARELLTTEYVMTALAEQRRRGAEHVTFLGGEPTIRPDFLKLVKYARHDLGFRTVFLTSNGRMLSRPQYAEALVKAGLTHLCLSLHGHTADLHDAITGSAGAFEQLLSGISELKKLNFPFRLTAVINRLNLPYLKEMALHQLALEPLRIAWAYVRPAGGALERMDEIVPRYAEAKAPLHEAMRIFNERRAVFTLAGVPLCFMQGFEKYCDELYWTGDSLRREVEKPSERLLISAGHGKLKNNACLGCSRVAVCDGVPVEYAKRRGFDEFKPLTGENINDASVLTDSRMKEE